MNFCKAASNDGLFHVIINNDVYVHVHQKINPLNSSRTVTQPHSCTVGNEDDLDDSDRLSSRSVLIECTALGLVFVLYKGVSRVHFNCARATGAHGGLG